MLHGREIDNPVPAKEQLSDQFHFSEVGKPQLSASGSAGVARRGGAARGTRRDQAREPHQQLWSRHAAASIAGPLEQFHRQRGLTEATFRLDTRLAVRPSMNARSKTPRSSTSWHAMGFRALPSPAAGIHKPAPTISASRFLRLRASHASTFSRQVQAITWLHRGHDSDGHWQPPRLRFPPTWQLHF